MNAAPDIAGLRRWARARSSGTVVSIFDGEAQGLEIEMGRWYTMCEDHSVTCPHDLLRVARSFASAPEEWCQGCASIVLARAALGEAGRK